MKRLIPFLLAAAICSTALAEMIEGRVVGVSDGDTITVLDRDQRQVKIRLSGIDAPEKAQPYGQRSKQHLSRLVFNKEVRVEWHKRDKYKRTIGKVWVQPIDCNACAQTLDANLAQLTAGLAWWYRQYAKEQPDEDQNRYSQAEAEAQARRVGLWADQSPMPPWEWRHR
jgi:endonuclease YncB( thermonuclease family)